MTWQDIVLSISNIVFIYAVIPQITNNFKLGKCYINKQTSLLTAGSLFVISATYGSLNLLWATLLTSISATLWTIVFIQGIFFR